MSTEKNPIDPKTSPSANGERKDNGQFAKGNRGGPGNPFARQTAALRKTLLACVSDDDMKAMVQALIAQAKEGNIQAAKLIFSYVLGKPGPAPDPDRLDHDEWRSMQDGAKMIREMEYLINAPKPQFTVDIGRMLGEQGTRNFGASMIDMLDHPEKYKPDVPDLVVPREPKANGKKKKGEPGASATGVHAAPELVSVVNGHPSTNGKSSARPAEALPPGSEEEANWLRILAERFPRGS